MKSRIRSRWYRANEKPLDSESKSNQMPKTPTGEISLLNGASLKDDLRDERAKKVARNGSNQKQSSENETAAGKGYKDRKKHLGMKSVSQSPEKKGVWRQSKQYFSCSAEGNQNNASNKSLKRSKAKNKQPQKSGSKKQNSSDKQTKQSGVTKFLSKIFGR